MKRCVIVSKKAFRIIKDSVFRTDNQYETGGVLIGYQLWRLYLVVAATTSKETNKSTMISFVLDGAEHTRQADDMIRKFKNAPAVLGIWHNHICDGLTFSKQDQISNKLFAEAFDGALSMLVAQRSNRVSLSVAYISAVGTHADCSIIICKKRKNGVTSCE